MNRLSRFSAKHALDLAITGDEQEVPPLMENRKSSGCTFTLCRRRLRASGVRSEPIPGCQVDDSWSGRGSRTYSPSESRSNAGRWPSTSPLAAAGCGAIRTISKHCATRQGRSSKFEANPARFSDLLWRRCPAT